VVLGHDDGPRGERRLDDRGDVQRLDRVEIDDARAYTDGKQRVRCREGFVHSSAGGEQGDGVALGGADGPRSPDREFLVGVVDHRCRHAHGAQVDDALPVGDRLHELGGLVGVGGDEHGAAVDGAEHGDVLECHLRRAVLADRDAGVRADELDVGAADRRHAKEVVRSGPERRER
jgi:hypothetical protein